METYYLAIDVGTGSVRAALVNGRGKIASMAAREHEQIVLRYGWSEQRPADWWQGAAGAIREVLESVPNAAANIAAICACGQMHGTVLIDADGQLTRETAPLWNDKRTLAQVEAFRAAHDSTSYLPLTANPATPAWPGFKLQWLKQNEPEAYERAATVFMSKDYVNFRLTGERAWDWSDASTSFLMDPQTRTWSQPMLDALGLDITKFPPIRSPQEILGSVTAEAAQATGLREGTPVLVGGADYPLSVLGSGVYAPGLGSDITGTSSIITVIADTPMLHPEVSNVATAEGLWGRFMLLDSGGDAMRWARRAFHENALSYDAVAQKAAEAPVGSEGLFFLPYLTGERLGEHSNSRAQFFGIGAKHGTAHLHRAVLEGVAFGVRRHIGVIESAGVRMERLVAASGGAKAALWLDIKASMYRTPILVPAEVECGVMGCAILAATAHGQFARLGDAVSAFVQFEREVLPDPRAGDIYDRMMPLFERLYSSSQQFYDDLDRLAETHA
ncbi:pentose kinase [Burkholderia sp. PAMC 28687]|uniref:Xylulose kinase n=1 Tax=Caballeronia sordidicola TaxID=196367 RepID=A0A242MLY6_CABSO|nr:MULTISPECIES: FGGY family carbohydrate kinase [Burkholderiaceae]AMM13990.1 pentose kinase [Burkholderia sp. PAMC 28687]OTP71983.1 Xylulose kinase [Caballeronia sordidicola]